MYVILRCKDENAKPEVCFVQAESANKAKKIVGVPENHSDWGVINPDFLSNLANAKEGYFVIAF